MDLSNKVALVTGSGRGIGKAIAFRLAEAGAAVVINDINEAAVAAAEELKTLGKNGMAVIADVTSTEDVNKMVETVKNTYGKIDILVNNAGVTRDQIILRMSDEDWDTVLRVNLKSVFICTRAVLKHMIRQRYGRIVNVASIVAMIGNPGQVNYSASKAGIIGLTRTAAKEVASRQITVNAVAPGFIETEMTRKLAEEWREELIKRIPLGTLGAPRDVAEAVAFLVSDEARYITGHVLTVDGGMVMV